MELKTRVELRLKQQQGLVLNQAMQQAFHVLQMPVQELAIWLRAAIAQNPLLDCEEEEGQPEESVPTLQEEQEIDFTHSSFEVLQGLDESFEASLFSDGKDVSAGKEDNALSYKTSLFEHLVEQAAHVFTGADYLLAEQLIGNLDARGFLPTAFEELFQAADRPRLPHIIAKIQSFDPSGIAAKNLQESLLIQLRSKGQAQSLAFRIVEKYYEDLIHNRMPLLRKKLKCTQTELQRAIRKDIAMLNMHLATRFDYQPPNTIMPDIYFNKEDTGWHIEVNDSGLPNFKIVPLYIQCLIDHSLEPEETQFVRRHMAAGKWLARIVERRRNTLLNIGASLIKRQEPFFLGTTDHLAPMTMEEIACELEVHESTIARAIAHKYVDCPRGVLPLRNFFTHAVQNAGGKKISNQSIKHTLQKLIAEEDKLAPLSDQALSSKMRQTGLPCARRTVTKYRALLKIPPASHRRQWAK